MTRLAALLNQSPEFSSQPPAGNEPAPERHAEPVGIAVTAAPEGQELDQLAAVDACQQALSRMLARLG